ncbi:MAG: ATP-binding protein [Gemmatimonadota bacterium]|nr:ATP-binding protein [Gemmatimonadota bacterium]
MSLTARLGLAALLPVMILVGVVVYHARLFDRMVEEHRRLAEIDVASRQLALELRADLARLNELVAKSEVLDDPEYAREADRLRRSIGERIAALEAMEGDPRERRAIAAVADAWRARETPGSTGATEDALGNLLDVVGRVTRERVAAGMERAERADDVSGAAALFGTVAALGLSALLGWSVARPVRRMGRATRDLAEGDFERRVEPAGPPEVAALAKDLNAMAERLGELDQLKEDLLSNVSHELKAPLASMRETVRLLLDEIPGPVNERQERMLSLTLESGERLSVLIENLLDLSRLHAGAMVFDFERRELSRLVRRVVDSYEVPVHERGIELETRWPESAVEVVCDPARVEQIVDNLVSNALKFTPEGGTIGVRLADRPDGGAVLEVEDDGPGVPDADKERIFERFYRADSSRKGSQGTGLGLAIAREVAVAHGGDLVVRDAPDGGSVFVLELPHEPDRPERAA